MPGGGFCIPRAYYAACRVKKATEFGRRRAIRPRFAPRTARKGPAAESFPCELWRARPRRPRSLLEPVPSHPAQESSLRAEDGAPHDDMKLSQGRMDASGGRQASPFRRDKPPAGGRSPPEGEKKAPAAGAKLRFVSAWRSGGERTAPAPPGGVRAGNVRDDAGGEALGRGREAIARPEERSGGVEERSPAETSRPPAGGRLRSHAGRFHADAGWQGSTPRAIARRPIGSTSAQSPARGPRSAGAARGSARRRAGTGGFRLG